MQIIIKYIFGIFLVLFALLIFLYSSKTRVDNLEDKYYFSNKEEVNAFFLSLLGNPCIASGNYINDSQQVPIHGFLDVKKLNAFHNDNQVPDCLENANFIYTLEVKDSKSRNIWLLGLRQPPSDTEDEITMSLPVSLNYNYTDIRLGRAVLHVYTGALAQFYSTIKKACITTAKEKIRLKTNYKVSYDNNENLFCIGDRCFFPSFRCRVSSFHVSNQENLLLLIKRDDALEVLA